MKRFKQVGRVIFALAFITFGISHFAMVDYFSSMVPGFIPFHDFWIYFIGAAYILAALSILLDVMTPWACIVLGFVVFFIAFSVHLPAVRGAGDQVITHWANFIKAILVGSAAWYMAGVFGKQRTVVEKQTQK